VIVADGAISRGGLMPQVAFPRAPGGWYYLCRSRDLSRGPVGIDIDKTKFAAFRDSTGRVGVLSAQCAHMGADLTHGRVVEGRLTCPLHGWEYRSDGSCHRIPASDLIPPFAHQCAYPAVEIQGYVFFCNRAVPPHPMPFFDGVGCDELLPAAPFEFKVSIPWYLVSANAFDAQHFRTAHDRTIVGEPVVDSPAPMARRIIANYRVTGDTWRDRLTRAFSGHDVVMSATVGGGPLVLVIARFRRTTSYGLVSIRPISDARSVVTIVVWVPRRRHRGGRLVGPVDVAIRRSFIRAFLLPDVSATSGIRYNPRTLIDADREMASYLDWLGTCVVHND
jgi:phenylpropionate dioxygenase-like ring-hydroxylating dioxygenase large terminal subunit